MVLIKKHKSKRRTHWRRTYRKRPIFRRRRRRGFFVFSGLVVLLLAGLGVSSFFGDSPWGASGAAVQRVDAPAVAEAPEPVADLQAQAEREAAEKKVAEEKAAEKEQAAPPAPEDPTLYLTVPRLGIYGHTVRNDDSQWALDQGAIKEPETDSPWQEGDTNTYIVGHRVSWPGTESYYQFYNLPAMQAGDEVILEDTKGTVYAYLVTEVFAVSPWETWVTKPIPGRDVVTLQTCTESLTDWWTPGPNLFSAGPNCGRLIVRADRVQ
jgi:sortase A